MQPKSTWNKACRNETVKKKLQVKSTGRVAYMRNCSTGMHEQVALLRFHSRRVDAGAYYGVYLQAYYRDTNLLLCMFNVFAMGIPTYINIPMYGQ